MIGTRFNTFMCPQTMENAIPKPRNNRKPLDEFIARKAEIDTMLDRLKALSDEHFNWSPDEINWGHVGTLAHYAELLKRITDAAFQEGEFAD